MSWFRLIMRLVVGIGSLGAIGVVYFAPTAALSNISGELAPAKAPTLRVMTYNVRVETESDGDDNWPYRKEAVAALIRYHQPDVFGLQECYFSMARELASMLPGYAWYARGTSDGKESGAANPVFYRVSRLEPVEQRTLWFSETPDVPSQGWGAQFPRVATLMTLREKTGGKTWRIANLHLDHRGQDSKKNSAKLLLAQFPKLEGVIVLGDFNSQIDGPATTEFLQAGMLDAQSASRTGHVGLENTYNGFKRNWVRYRKIDHILVSADLKVERHEIPGETVNGRIPSDHFPVIAEVAP